MTIIRRFAAFGPLPVARESDVFFSNDPTAGNPAVWEVEEEIDMISDDEFSAPEPTVVRRRFLRVGKKKHADSLD
jgi:hypothetical protein